MPRTVEIAPFNRIVSSVACESHTMHKIDMIFSLKSTWFATMLGAFTFIGREVMTMGIPQLTFRRFSLAF